jgi:hypothetical protein
MDGESHECFSCANANPSGLARAGTPQPPSASMRHVSGRALRGYAAARVSAISDNIAPVG